MNQGSDLAVVIYLTVVLGCSGCLESKAPNVVEPAWLHPEAVRLFDCNPDVPLFPKVTQSRFKGVIVSKEYFEGVVSSVESSAKFFGFNIDSFWTPSPQEVLAAEMRVVAAMSAATSDLAAVLEEERLKPDQKEYERGEIEKIVANLDSFAAQYAGIVVHGRKRILCNFMPLDEHFLGNRPLCHWIQVLDGGSWFWQIQYDVENDKCLRFESNGYA